MTEPIPDPSRSDSTRPDPTRPDPAQPAPTLSINHPEYVLIDVSSIVLNDRGRKTFKNIEDLMESIQRFGLDNPITVTPLPDQPGRVGMFELVAGERRLRALLRMGVVKIPCMIRKFSGLERKEFELEENIVRDDLTWIESNEIERQIWEIKNKKAQQEALRTGEPIKPVTLRDVAEKLGSTFSSVQRNVALAQKLRARPELIDIVKDLPQSGATRKIEQIEQRERTARMIDAGLITVSALITHGPAEKVLDDMPARSVDLVVTDPPFGIPEIEESRGSTRGPTQLFYASVKAHDNLDPKSAQKLFLIVMQRVMRVLKPSGCLYVFCSSSALEGFTQTLRQVGFIVQNWPIVWYKGRPTSPARGYWWTPCYELIIFAHKPPRKRVLNKPLRALIEVPIVPAEKRLHPFQKPLRILGELINQSSHPGEIVLDPFCGVGSTVIAAQRLGRIGKGIELDKDWFLIGQERLVREEKKKNKND